VLSKDKSDYGKKYKQIRDQVRVNFFDNFLFLLYILILNFIISKRSNKSIKVKKNSKKKSKTLLKKNEEIICNL
jgi:hypothetical protein